MNCVGVVSRSVVHARVRIDIYISILQSNSEHHAAYHDHDHVIHDAALDVVQSMC